MPTKDEVLDYLGIDYADDMVTRNIERCIKVSDAFIKGSIGENYPVDDPRIKELSLIVIDDLYENRGLDGNVSGNTRRLVHDLSLQLRLDLRRKANE